MLISFVIPCFRSEKTLKEVVYEIKSVVEEHNDKYEIILVNDCSPDATIEVIKNLCEEDPKIIGIDNAKNFGQHAALMAGFHYATGDIIVCLDDDGQTPASEMYKLIDKINEGFDVVYAKYNHKKHSFFRNLGSGFNKIMTEVMLGKPHDLYVSSYFAAKPFIISELLNYKNAYPYVIGLILRTTNNICNVDINHKERLVGTSGYSFKKLIALWMNGFTSFSIIPLRASTYCGALVSFIGFLYAIVIIVKKIIDPSRVMGWSSIMAVILIIGGVILLVLGMIGEYIGRIYICLNSSPQYVTRDVINAGKTKTNERK